MSPGPICPFFDHRFLAVLAFEEFLQLKVYLMRHACHRKVLALQDAQPTPCRISHQDIDIAGEVSDTLDAGGHDQLRISLERRDHSIVKRLSLAVQDGSHHPFHLLAAGLKAPGETEAQEGESRPVKVTIPPEDPCHIIPPL